MVQCFELDWDEFAELALFASSMVGPLDPGDDRLAQRSPLAGHVGYAAFLAVV